MIMKWLNKKIDERMMKKMSELINKFEDTLYEVAHDIDIDYEKLAEAMCIDPADIAGEMNESEIADHLEIDYYTLADKIEYETLGQYIDYDAVAENVDIDIDVSQLEEFIDHEELTKHIDMSDLAAQVYGNFVSIEDVSSIISDIKSIVLAVRKEEE